MGWYRLAWKSRVYQQVSVEEEEDDDVQGKGRMEDVRQ